MHNFLSITLSLLPVQTECHHFFVPPFNGYDLVAILEKEEIHELLLIFPFTFPGPSHLVHPLFPRSLF